jgi:hypothetical protein
MAFSAVPPGIKLLRDREPARRPTLLVLEACISTTPAATSSISRSRMCWFRDARQRTPQFARESGAFRLVDVAEVLEDK